MMMLDAALRYAKKGLSVFPCEKKIPLLATGFKAASSDETKIKEWWTEHPTAQVALPTGRVNHLFVLDIDGPLGAAIADKWNLPETLTVQTRPERQQLWFRQADGIETKCSAGVLGEQLDTRGDGGYIIAPPSIHHETGLAYRIVKNLPLAEVPAFLLEPKTHSSGQSSPDTIPKGKRHQTMLKMAGGLRARGLSPAIVLATLNTVNLLRCQPPLETAELEKLANYVGSKPAGFPGARPMETSASVEIECFTEVTLEELVWLWHKRVPLGKLTLFVGDPGQGKSLVTIDIAARVSRGDIFPDGAQAEVGDVIFLSAEDDPSDTQLPRLMAANADLSRIHRVKAVKVTLADGATGESMFNLERDTEKLNDSLARIHDPRLLVIDPLTAYLGHVDSHKDADIRRVLAPLSELAAKHRMAVAGVMHLKKSETSALLRVSGSIGFVAAARCVWGFGEDPVAVNTRVMVAVKNNLAVIGDGLGYRIEAFQSVPRIVWLKDPVHADANDILSGEKNRHSSRAARRSAAENWVRDMDLAGRGKPVLEIKNAAAKAEISWRTVQRAKEALPIRAVQRDGQWWWVFDGDDPGRQN